jgi:pimeloyl-ACP methyl ester carboxylesterase
MATASLIRTGLLRACPFAAFLVALVHPGVPAYGGDVAALTSQQLTITYRTHDGHLRKAYVLLPHGYRRGEGSTIPLVISPHGRAVDGKINTRRWGTLPTVGKFAVVNPDGYGRVLPLHSWGYSGQIADLARMPDVLATKLPWVHVDRSRIYAIGGSMGAQETLLLAGRYPPFLAGAVAVDGPSDFALQYRNFPRIECDRTCLARGWGHLGRGKQRLARKEIGGTPSTAAGKFARRSPIAYVQAIADSCIPVQIWWSRTDKVVLDPERQSGRMAAALRAANPLAPIDEYVGDWDHTDAMRHETDLPQMLAGLGLLPRELGAAAIPTLHDGPSVGQATLGHSCAGRPS